MRPLAAFVFAVILAITPAFASDSQTPTTDPIVAVWYRGTPAGTPVAEELAVIRALGFNGIAWPSSETDGLAALRKMAEIVGLHVEVVGPPRPVTPESLLKPVARVDILVSPANADALRALAWRAIARGARAIAFDAQAAQGAGLENPDRSLKPWVRLAIDVARQLTANPRLVNNMRPGPGVIVAPPSSPDLDVLLLDADRAWVIVATNTAPVPVEATVRLPAGTPYALWLNLLDATTLAMNGEQAGPRWSLKLEPRGVRVYVIDKVTK